MEKGRRWIGIFLILILVLNIFQSIKISQLREEFDKQEHNFNRINENINNIDRNVYNALNDWKKENRWIRDSGFEIKSLSDDLETMTISIYWDFNNLKNDEEVYLNIGRHTDSNSRNITWEKIFVESTGDLHYEKQLNLPFKANYTVEVIAENKSEKRSEKLVNVFVYDSIKNRIQVNGTTRKEGGTIRLWVNVVNHNTVTNIFYDEKQTKNLPEKARIDKAKLDIYIKGKLMETVDLLENGNYESGDDIEIVDCDKIFKNPEFSETDIKAIVRITDKLGLEYEKEVELE